jgi:hypothetical protein
MTIVSSPCSNGLVRVPRNMKLADPPSRRDRVVHAYKVSDSSWVLSRPIASFSARLSAIYRDEVVVYVTIPCSTRGEPGCLVRLSGLVVSLTFRS